ncbi:hypothetical protein O181_016280 [Austropuccinia psidii MF-1]|uniref:Reverse transcriptase/retrotransposon-derived protein RNase H-like domain-containing protein n=1 Tax=Austropuccinia psidii MF-1 TaxID=1389203 RepID=A0A9Q3C5H9_9BASI|nr:hypothetical protein [Austropuccinia psidii MF-1]
MKKSSSSTAKTSIKEHRRVAIFPWVSSYYRNHIKRLSHKTSSLHRLCSKDVSFEFMKERRDAYESIKHELTNAPALILPDFELPFKFYIDADFSKGLVNQERD